MIGLGSNKNCKGRQCDFNDVIPLDEYDNMVMSTFPVNMRKGQVGKLAALSSRPPPAYIISDQGCRLLFFKQIICQNIVGGNLV